MSKFYINLAIVLGNVVKDPELRYTPNGTAVLNFTVATNRSVKNGETYQDVPSYHNVVMYGKLAETTTQRLGKGSKVTVEGRIDYQSWEHKGQKYYKTQIVADKVIPMSGNNTSSHQEPDPAPPQPGQANEEVNVDDIPF